MACSGSANFSDCDKTYFQDYECFSIGLLTVFLKVISGLKTVSIMLMLKGTSTF